MSKPTIIAFVVRGKLEGVPISPKTIGLSEFNEFNSQVEEFIAGSSRQSLDEVQVRIEEGSYKLMVTLPPVISASLQHDLKALQRSDSLGEVDPRRQEIISKWQARSKRSTDWSCAIAPTDKTLPKIEITRESDFRVGKTSPWVAVEKYLYGQIVDMGGAQKANVHLRLESSGKTIILGTSQDYLQEQVENRLYRKVLVQVRAEQHSKTGELRNVHLISFRNYSLQYSEKALDAFAKKGRNAWADVTDPTAWVRELRGGK